MSYDERLADEVRALLAGTEFTERRMFGGLAFLVGGHMAVAASGKGGLMVRCDPAQTEALVADGAESFEMRGRPVDGWLRVRDGDIAPWVERGVAHARSLPPK